MNIRSLVTTAIIALIAVASTAQASDRHVPASYPTIQAGIDAASDGDTVIIAPGTYTGNGNRDIDFKGKAITVRGNPADPNLVVIDCQGTYEENHRGFLFITEETKASIIDGVTITRGFASGNDEGHIGGAVFCEYPACPTIANCIISSNSAGYGAGIGYNYYYDMPEDKGPSILNCTFINNGHLPHAAVIYCCNGTIVNCKIIDNSGSGLVNCNGEFIDCIVSGNSTCGFQDCSGLIKDCVISNNSFRGIDGFYGSIDSCEITGNMAPSLGAGINNKRTEFHVEIINCVIAGNKAYSYGGGVYVRNADIINCTIVSNKAGITASGLKMSGTGNVKNCIFWDNHSGSGVQVLLSGEQINFEANDLQGGQAENDLGGSLFSDDNIDADPMFADPGYWHDNGMPANSDDDYWVNGDYHLKSERGRWDPVAGSWVNDDVTSPCIDTGSISTDFINEPFPHGKRANMGAYGNTDQASKSLSDVDGTRIITVSLDGTADYNNIQAAIDSAAYRNDIVLVDDGTYTGVGNRKIKFKAKAITVTSKNGPKNTIIDCQGTEQKPRCGFIFKSGESAESLLSGFSIINGVAHWPDDRGSAGGGIVIDQSSPTISNCIITNCFAEVGSGIYMHRSDSNLINCDFSGNYGYGSSVFVCATNCIMENCLITGNNNANGAGATIICRRDDYNRDESSSLRLRNCVLSSNIGSYCIQSYKSLQLELLLENCIFWSSSDFITFIQNNGFTSVNNCNIQGGRLRIECPDDYLTFGPGNIDADPLFVAPGYWGDNGTPDDYWDDIWHAGDYHLKSAGWRWDDLAGQWTWDDVTSPCIDAGNPGMALADEPTTIEVDPLNRFGVNKRINMGAYGGTAQASMAPPGFALLADITNDGTVDTADLAILMESWLVRVQHNPADFTRDAKIDFTDFALLAQDWLLQTTWFTP